MTYPNLKNKHSKDALFSPDDYINYLKKMGKFPQFKIPESIIFCYQKSILDYAIQKDTVSQLKGLYNKFYAIKGTKGKVAILGGFGRGAPAAATVLEELIAFGSKKFISIGTAGTLQKKIDIGNLVICNKAIRDEGTSHHYLSSSKYSYSSPRITNMLKSALSKIGIRYSVGSSWTIDAIYRETIDEARKYQNEGVLTVEMEAAALYAVAKYKKVQLVSAFAISDSLSDLKWKPMFHHEKTTKGLETLFDASVTVLSS